MKCIFISTALLFARGILPVISQVVEGKTSQRITHRGDPPYLLESGWISLLTMARLLTGTSMSIPSLLLRKEVNKRFTL